MTDSTTSTLNQQNRLSLIRDRLTSLRHHMKRQYDRNIVRDLSSQNTEKLLYRNTIAVLNSIYDESIAVIHSLTSDDSSKIASADLPEFIAGVLMVHEGIVNELLEYAINKHRTSCALSNFPGEHKPSREYFNEVYEVAAKGWDSFSLQVNQLVSDYASS